MHKRWIGLIATPLVILVLGFALTPGRAAGQGDQDRETRIHQKMERLQALVQQRQQEGADLQPVGELMQGLPPLMEQQKFAEAEALLDRALELANKLGPPAPTGPPPSLRRKMECLQRQVQKWQEEGKDPQPIGEIMQDLPPLFEQQKFAEAERVVDRALKVAGAACPDQPTSPPAATSPGPPASAATPPVAMPPVSLQEKMQRLHALVEQKQGEGADLQPVGELMQGFESLMQQKKFSEAEALVDRALKMLGGPLPASQSHESDATSLIAYGARDVDGRQQIFVVEPDGAGKKRLTQDGKQNYFPVWSPDGKRLAWVSDRSGSPQIWVMGADGRNASQLTTEGTNVIPAWSPDGKRLTFTSDRSGVPEIWVMGDDGSQQKQLTKTTATGISGPFATLVVHETVFFGLHSTGAGIINHFASWSPDRHQIAFCSSRNGSYAIWAMDAAGGRLAQLTTSLGSSFPYANAPAWSPNSNKIVFWSGRDLGPGQIWVMDDDGSHRKQLTDQLGHINCDEPTWSADGSKIMFASNRPGSKGIGIWVMDADGTHQRILVTNTYEKSRASWRPVHAGL